MGDDSMNKGTWNGRALFVVMATVAILIIYGGNIAAADGGGSGGGNAVIDNQTLIPVHGQPSSWNGITLFQNVTYCTINTITSKGNEIDNMTMHLDLFYSSSVVAGNQVIVENPRPLVVYVHGGEWEIGDKNGVPPVITYIQNLVNNGFIVASINYRQAPQYYMPAMIQDTNCAIRYLKSHALQLGINASAVGAYGGSAGSQLATLDAVAPTLYDNEGQWLNTSASINAVADLFGPVNMSYDFLTRQTAARGLYTIVFNNSNSLVYNASPINYLAGNSNVPPILIMHGLNDSVIPYNQSTQFYNALIANRDNANIILVQNAEHNFGSVGGIMNPNQTQIANIIVSFFVQYLHPYPNPYNSNSPGGGNNTVAGNYPVLSSSGGFTIIYGKTTTLRATIKPKTDPISILINGNTLASGFGTVYYSVGSAYLPGSYNIIAVDSYTGLQAQNTLVVKPPTQQYSPPLVSASNGFIIPYGGFTTLKVKGIPTSDPLNLTINGVLVAQGTGSITYTADSIYSPGTYNVLATDMISGMQTSKTLTIRARQQGPPHTTTVTTTI